MNPSRSLGAQRSRLTIGSGPVLSELWSQLEFQRLEYALSVVATT